MRSKKQIILFWMNLGLCVAGTGLFLFFILAIEKKKTTADILFERMVNNPYAVIGSIILMGMALILPLFLRKR